MRFRETIEGRRKGCWLVELIDDGTIYVTSYYKRGYDWPHKIPKGAAPSEKLPKYVRQMVIDMREARPEVSA